MRAADPVDPAGGGVAGVGEAGEVVVQVRAIAGIGPA
jgi:hypothetical protein